MGQTKWGQSSAQKKIQAEVLGLFLPHPQLKSHALTSGVGSIFFIFSADTPVPY